MLGSLRSGFRNLQFWSQLAIVFSAGILILALITSVAVSSMSSVSVHTQLMGQGLQITESLASQSKIALLYRSSDVGAEAAEATLNFPDISGAGIYTLQGDAVFTTLGDIPFHKFSEAIAPHSATLITESPDNWFFAAPVYASAATDPYDLGFGHDDVAPELIGYVFVDISKDSLQSLGMQILRSNIWVSLAVAVVLLLVLIAWSRRLTSPLERLSQLMHRARGGEEWLRSDVGGSRDIAAMQEAFNTMMESLELRNMELRHARDVALDSARTKGEFAANVSHELRTPMNGILGMLDLLATMGLTHKQQEYVVTARRSGESLLALIDDILSFSKVDAGMLTVEAEDCHLEEMLDEVMTLIGNEALKKGLDVGYVIASDVPRLVHLDGSKLRQVLVNLGGNAVKFTSQGEVAIRIECISGRDQENILRFEVSDTGIGVPPEAHEHIFQAFTQADSSTTRNFGGTGLGLAIAKELVCIMGGEVRLSSEVGRGSTFWFTVPLDTSSLTSRPEKPAFDIGQRQVVVIESCGLIIDFLRAEFENLGVEARFFDRGIDGLNYLRLLTGLQAVVFVSEDMRDLKAMDLIALLEQSINEEIILPIVLRNPWASSFKESYNNNIRLFNKPLRSQKVYEWLSSIVKEQTVHPEAVDYSGQLLGFDVLVVDDNHSNQLVAEGMLEKLGCNVTVAGTGKEALECVARKRFHLILMDCHMPVMDGFEATRQIRRLEGSGPHMAIIAMTANNRSEDVRKCLDSGMDDFLGKPLRLDTLQEKILHWLKPQLVSTEAVSTAFPEPVELGQVIDRSVISELKESVGEVFEAMLGAFLEDTPVYISSLKIAAADGQLQQVRDLAHTIKGSAANFGARRVVELARAIQDQAVSGTVTDFSRPIQELSRAFALLKRALESLSGEENMDAWDASDQFRILVVDDDRSMRIALANAVSQDGYLLDQASNGVHALSLCQRKMPDLILMDALMPEMDGFTACRRIREMPGGFEVPILMITGLEDENSIVRAFSAGATDYVPKPVHFSVLRQRMARLLQASKAEKHVKKLAYYDTLTGLPNRANLMQTLKVALNRAVINESLVAVLFLDLDRFKLINDTLGHDAGDLLLKAVADRIRRCVRENDFVARLGGDEFTVVLQDVRSLDNIAHVAEKICNSISSPFVFLQQKMYLSTSIGISLFPNDADDVSTLLKHADSAMFRAKENRNQFCFYKHGMEDEIARRIELENDLRQAVADGAFELYYQPQFDAKEGLLVGVEALLRWNHPRRGLLTADKFIGLAEESTLINEISVIVVREASRQARIWHDQGHRLRIAVNLSARDLQTEGMHERLSAIIQEEGADPAMLEFEITETVLLENPEKTIEELQRFRDMGITLAIDDFGSGYSSLNYLRKLPVDLIKIDRSFIADLDERDENRALVQGIVALSHSMGMQTVAEGVETEAQRDLLMAMGCDYFQGFFFAKPLKVADFEQRFLDKFRKTRLTIVQ